MRKIQNNLSVKFAKKLQNFVCKVCEKIAKFCLQSLRKRFLGVDEVGDHEDDVVHQQHHHNQNISKQEI